MNNGFNELVCPSEKILRAARMPSQLIRRSPHPLLADSIDHFWFVEREFNPPNATFDLLPDSFIEVVFAWGGTLSAEYAGTMQTLSPAFIVGLLPKPLRLYGEGTIRTAAARFFPWGFPKVFDIQPGELNSLEVSSSIEHIQATLNRQEPDAVLDVLETFLIQQVLRKQFDANPLVNVAQHVLNEKGQVNIREIADQVFYSSRHLTRIVKDLTGLTPKALARQIRFQAVRDAITADPESDLRTLAHASGYSDQAHMTREFRQFSDKTPKQFAAEMRLLRLKLRDSYHVVFLQNLQK